MRTKKIFTYALVALLSFALVIGCSSKTQAPAKVETIKIGGIFELTGEVAEFGKKGENGVRLAIKEANEKGGILGKQIEYISADNKSEAGESTAAATKLITQDNVIAIVGPMTTGNTLAVIPVVTENKIPLVTPTATNATITVAENGKLNEWIFRACFIDPFQGEVAANFALETLNAKTAAMVVDQKGDYAKGLAENFKKTFEAAGGKVVASEQYVAGQDKDFRAILTNIRAANPDVIFVPGYYGEAGLIVKQARELKINAAMIGGDGWGTGPMVEVAGAEAMNNTYYSDHVAADDPSLAEFAAAYKAEYNQDVDSFAVLGYDAAKILLDAIERAGSTDPEAIRKALEETKGFVGVSGEINIDPATHNPKKSATILKFVDGKKEFATRVDPK
ncbi:MAG TPA: ABC transporter substrate-binding protein [Peptococcaceae bacterium]|nr:ABC transporter substrate-binding protein [Peptococcaceae bacterium]